LYLAMSVDPLLSPRSEIWERHARVHLPGPADLTRRGSAAESAI